MLPKKRRLPVHNFFSARREAIPGGKTPSQERIASNKHFTVRIVRNEKRFDRFGVVVGTKVSKKATTRNKLRRLIFNALRGINGNIKKDRGLDILIIARPSIAGLTDEEIIKHLEELLRRI